MSPIVVNQLVAAYGTPMPIIPRGLTKDGKYYAIPFFSSSDAWFLRKDKLAEKGIKPESLDTYEKMRDAALEISDPSKNFFGWGQSPYAVGDGPTLIFHVVHSWGGSLQDKTGTKVVFNSPETVAGVTWLADIYTNPKYKNMLPTGYESWDGAAQQHRLPERHDRYDRQRLHHVRQGEGRQEPGLREYVRRQPPEGPGDRRRAADRRAARLPGDLPWREECRPGEGDSQVPACSRSSGIRSRRRRVA